MDEDHVGDAGRTAAGHVEHARRRRDPRAAHRGTASRRSASTVVPPEEGTPYLDLFNAVDIVLDTFPVSGGTTAGDALWMGRPMVTLAAASMPASRRAAVFLKSVGLDDLVAATPDQYVEIAGVAGARPRRLARLAETLRDTLIRSPVMDAAGCAAAMMAFYREAWRTWCARRRRRHRRQPDDFCA